MVDHVPKVPLQPGFTSFATNDVATAAAYLDGIYRNFCYVSWDLPNRSTPFHFGGDLANLGRVKLLRGNYSGLKSTRELQNAVQIFIPLSGSLKLLTGKTEIIATAGAHVAGVMHPNVLSKTETFDGMGLCLELPLAMLHERLRSIAGHRYSQGLAQGICAQVDVRTVIGRMMASSIVGGFENARDLALSGHGALAGALLEDALANIATAALFPKLTDFLENDQPDLAPSAIRKVYAYIEAHFDQPITLLSVAQMFDVPMRTLQENFRRHYGFTPKEFLIDCRLNAARQGLATAPASLSVTAIAMESGFTDMSFFAARYRTKFREHPSVTRRRSRAQ